MLCHSPASYLSPQKKYTVTSFRYELKEGQTNTLFAFIILNISMYNTTLRYKRCELKVNRIMDDSDSGNRDKSSLKRLDRILRPITNKCDVVRAQSINSL